MIIFFSECAYFYATLIVLLCVVQREQNNKKCLFERRRQRELCKLTVFAHSDFLFGYITGVWVII